ncbi:hypothetical protein DL93DRAFT_2227766 [Clavulina sp. PMI_390]|nr:hypothetical protein DL93DRAFT_2227766 [Clavulina sp. PMI_390]
MKDGVDALPSSGPLWFHRINFDSLFAIIFWLDPLSVLQLSLTCKFLQDAIGNNTLIWRHILRGVCEKQGIAPHSFSEPSTNDMKRLSTCPNRLVSLFRDPTRQLNATLKQLVLDFGVVLPAESDGIKQDVEYLTPYLLPGGRWMLSGIINNTERSTYLLCWDRIASHIDGSPLRPVTAFKWKEQRPQHKTDWLKTQLYSTEAVTIACSLCNWTGNGPTHRILCLAWGITADVPLLGHISQFDEDPHHDGSSGFRVHDIYGDYMIFSRFRSIVIWNWKENLVGRIDDEDDEWNNDEIRLSLTAAPPYIFIIAPKTKRIVILQIPRLHRMESQESYTPLDPVSKASHPFPDEIETVGRSSILVFQKWKNPSLRLGFAIFAIGGTWEAEYSVSYLLSIRGTASPFCSQQLGPEVLGGNSDGAGVIFEPEGGILFAETSGPWDINPSYLRATFYPFESEYRPGLPVAHGQNLPLMHNGFLGSLCFVSGMALSRETYRGDQRNTKLVGVVSF